MPEGTPHDSSSADALAARLANLTFPTVNSAQRRAVPTSTQPRHTSPFNHPDLPQPRRGYECPRPIRVEHRSFLATNMYERFTLGGCLTPPSPPLRHTLRRVDGCELARQEQSMVHKAKLRLPSEQLRDKRWREWKEEREWSKFRVYSPTFKKRRRSLTSRSD